MAKRGARAGKNARNRDEVRAESEETIRAPLNLGEEHRRRGRDAQDIQDTYSAAESETPLPPPQPQVAANVADMVAMLMHKAFESLVEKVQAQPGVNALHGGDTFGNMLPKFLKLKPPVFTGVSDTEDPQLFIDGIQKALNALECTSTRSAELAAYQLENIAETWFKSFKRGRPVGSPPLTWDEFSEAFMDRFLPHSKKDAFAMQFEALRQTVGMSVDEYDREFTRLSRYAPSLVEKETMRVKRFIRGLQKYLFNPLATHLTKCDINYSQAVDVAREVEARGIEERAIQAQNKRTKTTGYYGGNTGSNRGSGSQNHHRNANTGATSFVNSSVSTPAPGQSYKNSTPSFEQAKPPASTCNYCHRNYSGECWGKMGACLRCGQMGHFRDDCPRRKGAYNQASAPANSALKISTPQNTRNNLGTAGRGVGYKGSNTKGSGMAGRGQSRTFALTRQDAQASNAVVTDKLVEADTLSQGE